MNVVDILILCVLGFAAFNGFRNGLVKEVLGIIGIILAVFLTFQYMDAVGFMLEPFFDGHPAYLPFLSGAIVFTGTLVFVHLIAWAISKLLQIIQLSLPNRLLGLLFSVLKSGIILSALLLILSGFGFPGQQTRDESYTYPVIIRLAPYAYDTVAFVYPGADHFDETLRQNLSKYNPTKNLPIPDNN